MKVAFAVQDGDIAAEAAASVLERRNYSVRRLQNGDRCTSQEIALFSLHNCQTNSPNRWLRVSPWRIENPPEWATTTPFWIGVRQTPASAHKAQDGAHRFEAALLGIADAYTAWQPQEGETLPPWFSRSHNGKVTRGHEQDYQGWLARAKDAAQELLTVTTPQEPSLPPEHIEVKVRIPLGEIKEKKDIQSTEGPFRMLFGYKTHYTSRVIRALGTLYREYNTHFARLVEANREWNTDYQYCQVAGAITNFAVQIDMKGLSQGFLDAAAHMSEKEILTALRSSIYEFENSLAMYQLLERSFPDEQGNSFFRQGFRATLDEVRQRFQRPIALLAVTAQKYQAMRQAEFGKALAQPLTDAEVRELSGFDTFWGPEEFRKHIEENKGICRYLLYARTSDPIAKLKDSTVIVDHPLLGDPQMRRIIKANTVTMNIDAPGMPHERRINDTKAYMAPMNMGFGIQTESDLYTGSEKVELSEGFRQHLTLQGIDPSEVESGKVWLRMKPTYGHYGCYGHVRGPLNRSRVRSELRTNLNSRGPYVVQPEMKVMVVVDQDTGREYTVIDRNFISLINGQPYFLGGFRSLMPLDSTEAREGRNHGNSSTVWAEVLQTSEK